MGWACKECGALCTIQEFAAYDGLCPKCRHRDRRSEAPVGLLSGLPLCSCDIPAGSGCNFPHCKEPAGAAEFYRDVPGAPDPKSDPIAAAVDRAWSDLAHGKPAAPLLTMDSPVPEGGCGCRVNGVPVMKAQCPLHRVQK